MGVLLPVKKICPNATRVSLIFHIYACVFVLPLEIVADIDSSEAGSNGLGYSILTNTLRTLKAFMKYYDPSIEEDVLTMFSEVVQDTYKRYKIDFDSDFTKFTSQDFPTFDDVYATIKGRLLSMPDKTRERDVMERLELKVRPLVKELRYYFTGHTTLQIDSDFIVFNDFWRIKR